jgi:hypothetical protein
MTNATMNRDYNPERSPLFGIYAVIATAVTLAIAVLLPAHLTPTAPPVAAAATTQRADLQAPAQFVTLPAVEVLGTRQTKSAANGSFAVSAVFKVKS